MVTVATYFGLFTACLVPCHSLEIRSQSLQYCLQIFKNILLVLAAHFLFSASANTRHVVIFTPLHVARVSVNKGLFAAMKFSLTTYKCYLI
jgi:hypothetical protein